MQFIATDIMIKSRSNLGKKFHLEKSLIFWFKVML